MKWPVLHTAEGSECLQEILECTELNEEMNTVILKQTRIVSPDIRQEQSSATISRELKGICIATVVSPNMSSHKNSNNRAEQTA